jgi:hypothetical protein
MSDATSDTGWRERPTGLLVSVTAFVVIVVLVGGMALGYEIEKSRVKKRTTSTPTTVTTPSTGTLPAARAVGSVLATSPNVITIMLHSGATRRIALAKGTVVVRAGSGTASDITTNQRVVYAAGSSSTTATAVIVLPSTARLGALVSATDSTTMSVKVFTKVMKITTTGATVNKVSPATLADVTKGAKVLVQTVPTTTGVHVATEIIVLPANSAFQ